MQANRCTQLYVYGSLDTHSPGWLGKRDTTGRDVIFHQALAYAIGNRAAGEVTPPPLPPDE